MDKNAIKGYAGWARRELIKRVAIRAAIYGITEEGYGDIDSDIVDGRVLSAVEKIQRQSFISKIRKFRTYKDGYTQAIEEVAYTWFNRFCALRYMEVNGYLPTHVRVFTNANNEFKPQILEEANHLELEGLDREKVYEFKSDNDTEGLYRYLLTTQCNALNDILPGMFQRIEDYSELLMPDNLLREGNVLEQMIERIPEEDWKDQVQIIGWLYQYYIAEKKDEVFAALSRNVKITKENIPAATQLFTPDWIVHYMVENSLGRLWVEGHPSDGKLLKKNWKYYLEEAEQEAEVEKQLKEIRKWYSKLKPEDIRCIDPCAGSGHILVYLFDILMQIYESCGYTTQEAVKSILENNLYGLDIDDRAAQLAYFAVMMKARNYDRNFFGSGIQPHVYAIEESNGLDGTVKDYFVGDDNKLKHDLNVLVRELKDAKEYGSIINVTPVDFAALYARVEEIKEDTSLYVDLAVETILPLIRTGELLSRKYDVVVTNPPYMGSGNMNAKLSEFVKANYPDSKSDLFAVFIERGNNLTLKYRYNCMVTMQSWMFLSSFEKIRKKILATNTIRNLMHMENMVMRIAFGTAVTVFQNYYINKYKGTYNQIKLIDIENECPKEFPIFDNRFAKVSADQFSKIPGTPIVYWASENVINSFVNGIPLESIANVKIGMGTGKNAIFVRQWWEIYIFEIDFSLKSVNELDNSDGKYFPYNKGGDYRLWYGNLQEVLWFDAEGRAKMGATSGHRENGGYDYYFKKGITWTFISSSKFGVRLRPFGSLFDVAGSTLFLDDDKFDYLLAFLSSNVCNYILKMLNPTLNYQAGNIKSLPIKYGNRRRVDELSKECVELSQQDWDAFETSWDFQKHHLVPLASETREQLASQFAKSRMEKFGLLSWHYDKWDSECKDRFSKLKANEEELNRIFIEIYGLQDELTPEVEDKDVTVRLADKVRDIKSLISYAVGCMAGRYSLDKPALVYAGGKWDDKNYKTFIPDDDAIIPICDDEYFSDDIVGRFEEFIKVVYGKESVEENLRFIADALGESGPSREAIRKYFLNNFYKDHCKIYKDRPIYWLFDSGKKNGFKCLIYLHRYKPDMIARIRTRYIHEQQSRYRTIIEDLEKRVKEASSTSARVKLEKKLAKFQEQAEELHKYEEKIRHLADQAPKIDLDDGVKVNYEKFKTVLAKIK